ncbi:GntR family transcriptional regulator [Phragmitibacter flavus]|uniref:GntR family transcriptional regulator n=1 Tax=Phragmitibacter flavus TaxID=2576071 RepID=A0A5R8KCS3_9BACT|nr:substrate-binding domain-containing protein [Phragmitibacter flavus]TLD70037.1 GntR family transcriptional regulator [Phragmitibacter flavus]
MSASSDRASIDLSPRRYSLVMETAKVLRETINQGKWREFLPGERVLCDLWQISRPTLRAAMQMLQKEGLIEITQGCRTKVLMTAPEQVKGPMSVCLLSPEPLEMMPPFVMLWLDELRRQLAAAGNLLHVQVGKAGFSSEQPEHALRPLIESASSTVWVLYQSTEAMQRWFAAQSVRCVVVGSVFEGVKLPSVDKDYRAACRHAVGLLVARGHRRLAMLIQQQRFGGDWESEAGFEEGLAALRQNTVQGRIVHHDGSLEQIERAVQRLIRQVNRPTALLVARSAHALTVLTVLLGHGIRIPQDMALLCRDDDAFLDHVVPRMARYTVSPGGFAKRIFRLVMQPTSDGHATKSGGQVMPNFASRESL